VTSRAASLTPRNLAPTKTYCRTVPKLHPQAFSQAELAGHRQYPTRRIMLPLFAGPDVALDQRIAQSLAVALDLGAAVVAVWRDSGCFQA
jgi:hypothetical protein